MKFTIPVLVVLMLSVCQSPGQAQMNWQYDNHPNKHNSGYNDYGRSNSAGNNVIRFRQSGGFAAVNRTARVRVGDLNGREQRRFEDAIRRSGIMRSNSVRDLNPRAADVFVYEIKISDRRGSHDVVFDDTTLPQSYRPLINLLAQKANGGRYQ